MNFALATIWHERNRFLPGVLAVAFSALLIAIQFGVLLGLLSLTSVPIDRAAADIWVGYPGVPSVDLGRPIPDRWVSRIKAMPEVDRVEKYVIGLLMLDKTGEKSNTCAIVGFRTDDDSLGAIQELTPPLRSALSEPRSVVVAESDRERFGFSGIGDTAEVLGLKRVRLVGTVPKIKSLAAPYLFCSVETAQELVTFVGRDQATFLLAKCKSPSDAESVAARLRRQYPDMAAYTKDEFSTRSRWYWLVATKTGIAIGGSALLGLLVGIIVTSQTLYAATAASLKEYATLRALGIPSWRIAMAVIEQSLWIGGAGVALALPIAFGLAELIEVLGARALLPPWLLGGSAAMTMGMAVGSGLLALRSLRLIEPAELLR
jgi:putative ABC transport system permease protein